MPRAVAVIPARLASTRLPRKMLRQIAGRPLLAHVYDAVRAAPRLDQVIVATDSEEILALCRQHGWNGRLTSAAHRSGTDRVHEVATAIAADVYINVQGDEPLVRPEHIAALLDRMEEPGVEVATLMIEATREECASPNVVKVAVDLSGRALYFSRAPIPYDRDAAGAPCFKHLGLYAYRRPALERFCSLPESPLERAERLEQLRFLENGIAIHVSTT
ncbi:MAG: 3-deoxy-manno-octulosonate cytidylyltransferase, partial [Terriglobales bacterium]